MGNPPITKWFYPNFVVVFENDKVLHAVVVARLTRLRAVRRIPARDCAVIG